MQTTSVMIHSLCVPCFNHCRYCLLSWKGHIEGADWKRSVSIAERYLEELRAQRPELSCSFSFGYSMEHTDLRDAIRTLRRLGSPTAEYLQCDGMRMRDACECRALMELLRGEGIRHLNFTVYGLADYHDRFAGRPGDFALTLRMMSAAKDAGIPFSAGIPLTTESIAQTESLVSTLQNAGCKSIRLFIPHEEGRGACLHDVRLSGQALNLLSHETRKLLNGDFFRTEAEWLNAPNPVREDRRMILLSLRPENIGEYERRNAVSVVEEIEALDEAYYAAFPVFRDLAKEYGNPKSDLLYSIRDLYHFYRRSYAKEHGVHVYDVTDERRNGSRRY